MTVPTTTSAVSYTGTGATSVFPFSWEIAQAADLVIYQKSLAGALTKLTLTTDYTVSGAGVFTGGNVTLVAGNLASGVGLFIASDPEQIQQLLLQQGAAFNPADLMNALDLLTREVQANRRLINLSLHFPVVEALDGLTNTLPIASLRANTIPFFDADGNATVIGASGLSPIFAAGNYIVDHPTFTAGVTTALTLSQAPGTVSNAWVFFDGVLQQTLTFTVSGLTLTLSSPVPAGVLSVEVRQAGVLPINTPADNSVGTSTIQNGAVTAAKLGAGSVTSAALAASSVGSSNIIDGSISDNDLASGVGVSWGDNWLPQGSAELANGLDYVASVSGTFKYGKCELCKGALTGTTVAGTLTQGTGSGAGVTGFTFQWNAVTTTGAGTAAWRFFLEAKNAAFIKNQTMSFGCIARHNAGVAIPFGINVYKANATDDFSAVTLISTGGTTSVASAVNSIISNAGVSLGDCSNGLLVEIVATVGVVTSKQFEIADVRVNWGSSVKTTTYHAMPFPLLQDYALRYFETLGVGAGGGPTVDIAFGVSTSATNANRLLTYSKKRAAPALSVQTIGSLSVIEYDGTTAVCTNYTGATGGLDSVLGAFTVAAGLTASRSGWLRSTAASGIILIDARF